MTAYADWTTGELERLIEDANAELVRRWRRDAQHKRERDAERHMDVHCPRCGAHPGARCLSGYTDSGRTKRLEVSHPERAWKTCPCPACGAAAGESCRVPGITERVYVTGVHEARVP
jgi:hypothetical protein